MVSLAQALGRAIAGHSGLSYFQMPNGLAASVAASIVRAANDARPTQGAPYAILIDAVDGAKHLAAPNVPVVSARDSVMYRHGDRAAVIYGRQPDLASFLQTFQEVGGPSYPDGSSAKLATPAVAGHLADALAAEFGVDLDGEDAVSTAIAGCLATLRAVHQLDEHGVGAWNVRWFRHVSEGLETLEQRIRTLADSGSPETLVEAVQRWAPASFGLPYDSAEKVSKSPKELRDLVDAFHESWSDSDSARRSIAQIAARTGKDELNSLETGSLDAMIAEAGDSKLGLTNWLSADDRRLEMFHQIDHQDFVNPSGFAGDLTLEMELANGGSLALMTDVLASPLVVPLALDAVHGGRRPRSESISVFVPWQGPADAIVPSTLCSITVSTATAASWITEETAVVDGRLRLTGYFEVNRGTGNTPSFRSTAVSLQVDQSHALAANIPGAPTRKIHFLNPDNALLVLAPIKRNNSLGKETVLDPQDDGDDWTSEELSPAEFGYLAALWHRDPVIPVTLDGQTLESHESLPEIRLARFVPEAESTFVAGDFTFKVFPVAPSSGQQSALIAAALGERVTADRPDAATEHSFRGQMEEWYARRVLKQDSDFLNALGHVVMPSNHDSSVGDVKPHWGGSVLVEDTVSEHLAPALIQFPFEDDFARGREAQTFRESFLGLGLDELLARNDSRAGAYAEWPSRTSVRSLWTSQELRGYIEAYTDLVDAARKHPNELMLFWAAYPMSVSVWDIGHGGQCEAVLMSPLHPIRLAWLAGCESALDEALRSRELLGTIEGWNFPVVGPGTRRHRRMAAVPVDAGRQQIFLGWSMMVAAGTQDPMAVRSPARIGDTLAPGTAASGLNQASVDSALRSYRRMQPHVSTLTIDLRASERQNRVSEIDEAVLRITQEWSSSGEMALAGGIRVLDSTLRDGAPPRDGVAQLVRANRDLLVTWSRYSPDPLRKMSCDIRFLEGSGVHVQVTTHGRALGAVGRYPLRRFEVHGTPTGYDTASSPGVRFGSNESAIVPALRAVEGDGPAIVSSLDPTMLSDGSANWTVMGETHLNPAAMSRLMQQYGSHRSMLWEWRPPLFDRSKRLPLVERRPHISIAKVPDTFGSELEVLLERATGTDDVSELKAQVIRTLGQRGVGLSSLLSLGGTHVAGALGFFLAFALFDHARKPSRERFLIPIDAADYFLRVLAGVSEHGQRNRRADLLLIELGEGSVVLSPVEIKSYGLMSTSEGTHLLPEIGSSALNESCEQLRASAVVVDRIARESESIQEDADRALWFNALATLVETAIKLRPAPDDVADKLACWLQKISNGQVEVGAGAPILMYFDHQAQTFDGGSFRTGIVEEGDLNARSLITDTASAFRAVNGADAEYLHIWSDLVNDATRQDEAVSQPPVADHGQTGGDGGQTESSLRSGRDIDQNGGLGNGGRIEDRPRPGGDGGSASIADRRGDESDQSAGGVGGDGESASIADRTGDETDQPAGGVTGIVGDGVRVSIGNVLESVGRAGVDYWASNTELNQLNVGIVGDLGTGKTEFIKALLAQIREQARESQPSEQTSILIFDYKGDFQSPEFLHRVGGVVLTPHKIPLNVFMPVTEDYARKPFQQAGAFVDTLGKIYSGVGPVQSSTLKRAIRDLFEANGGEPPTLADVYSLYLERQERPDSVSSILETFVLNDIFDPDRANLRSFGEVLEGRVLVVALNHLGADQEAKNALVALFLNLYYDFMIRSPKPPFQGSRPQLRYIKSYLVVDEAVNIMRYDFSVLMDLMLQGRQFGFGVVLASQFLTHFDAGRADYKEPLRTWVIHRVPGVTARGLASLGMTDVPEHIVRRVSVLEKHQALFRSFGCESPRLVRVTPYYELFGL